MERLKSVLLFDLLSPIESSLRLKKPFVGRDEGRFVRLVLQVVHLSNRRAAANLTWSRSPNASSYIRQKVDGLAPFERNKTQAIQILPAHSKSCSKPGPDLRLRRCILSTTHWTGLSNFLRYLSARSLETSAGSIIACRSALALETVLRLRFKRDCLKS